MDGDRFEVYDDHAESLIQWLIPRLDEDEVLAKGIPMSRLARAVLSVTEIRTTVNDYRRCVYRVMVGRHVRFWQFAARYQAFCLRVAARGYRDRAGFDPAWLHPPAG